jgi:hypothetical protein
MHTHIQDSTHTNHTSTHFVYTYMKQDLTIILDRDSCESIDRHASTTIGIDREGW